MTEDLTRLMSTVRFRKLGIMEGDGSKLFGRNKEYIDFFTDVGTASLGYKSLQMQSALARIGQAGIIHSPILFETTVREDAASHLTSSTMMDKVFFCNSGVEAVEAAIKLARLHWHCKQSAYGHKSVVGVPVIWTQRGSFHGRTLAGIAAGDGPSYHTAGFGPLPHGFIHFDRWEEIPADAAAVLISPIFGNNDVKPFQGDTWSASTWNLEQLSKFCVEHEIPLIFDEVQSGAGRCGAMTFAQKIGVQPDIITLGKGIAMGAPVGAMLARGLIADMFTPGSHFSTFGGNPLCCNFLVEMLRWLQSPGCYDNIEETGNKIEMLLLEQRHVNAVRRKGMLIAVDVDVDTMSLAQRCEDAGLLLGIFRSGPGCVKITPPLNISPNELMEGLQILMLELSRG